MLTATQAKCLSAIEHHLDAHGIAPSYDDLRDALGQRSKSGIHRLITALEERGFIRRLPRRARALEIIKPQTHPSPDYLRGFADGAEAERRNQENKTANGWPK